ncbi:MAG: hypothetical protein QOH21_1476, partial [Acidobacteriota bacterium]|nr:hypothetical protein [Acidobacteriota bacterium]
MQYTIEARELTSEYTHRPSYDGELRRTMVEAHDANAAISEFIRQHESELVSFVRPGNGAESIATV